MCQSSLSTNFLLTFEELLDVKRPRTDGTLKRLAPSSVSSSFYLLLLLVIIMHYCLLLCLVFVFNVFSVAVLSSFCSLSSSSPSLSLVFSSSPFFFFIFIVLFVCLLSLLSSQS